MLFAAKIEKVNKKVNISVLLNQEDRCRSSDAIRLTVFSCMVVWIDGMLSIIYVFGEEGYGGRAKNRPGLFDHPIYFTLHIY